MKRENNYSNQFGSSVLDWKVGNWVNDLTMLLHNMIFDILALINSGVVTTVDLEGFSDELKESVANFTNR